MLCGNRKAYAVKKKVASNWDRPAPIVRCIVADVAMSSSSGAASSDSSATGWRRLPVSSIPPTN